MFCAEPLIIIISKWHILAVTLLLLVTKAEDQVKAIFVNTK